MKIPEQKESEIEGTVKTYARRKGWKVYKFRSPGKRAAPDDIFLRSGICFFIEFKRPGKEATVAQAEYHKHIRGAGFKVFVIDNIGKGLDLIDSYEIFC